MDELKCIKRITRQIDNFTGRHVVSVALLVLDDIVNKEPQSRKSITVDYGTLLIDNVVLHDWASVVADVLGARDKFLCLVALMVLARIVCQNEIVDYTEVVDIYGGLIGDLLC